MAATPSPIIEYLQTVETEYRDNRVISELEHRCLVWFFVYGENVLSQIGWRWRGAVFRQRETQCMLVVKSGTDEVPRVAFVTGRTPTDCVRIFCRQWHNDTCAWYDDKYA